MFILPLKGANAQAEPLSSSVKIRGKLLREDKNELQFYQIQ